MEDREFILKVALMRKAQKAYWARAQKADWSNAQEKMQSMLHCKRLEKEVDDLLAEADAKPQTLFH